LLQSVQHIDARTRESLQEVRQLIQRQVFIHYSQSQYCSNMVELLYCHFRRSNWTPFIVPCRD
jgi:hypothetical protein